MFVSYVTKPRSSLFIALLAGLFTSVPGPVRAQEASPAQNPPVPAPVEAVRHTPVAGPRLPVPQPPVSFVHPGLLNNLPELETIRAHIRAGQEPWKSAFEQMKASNYCNLNYNPRPVEISGSGIMGRGGDAGGAKAESKDSKAAYTMALMWFFTGDERYAKKAVEILNAWTILRGHSGANWYLQASWVGSMWPNAAEIIRSTYSGWSATEITAFSNMLNRAYLPELHHRLAYGNREFSTINALVAIGVFNNDRAAFYEGVTNWVNYVPTWIYSKEDGPTPFVPDYWKRTPSDQDLAKLTTDLYPEPSKAWFSQAVKVIGEDRTALERGDLSELWNGAPLFEDGLCSETFRDMAHCDLGFASLIYTAEIAWKQGIDLYSIHARRIMAFMEFHAGLRIDEKIPYVYYRVQFNSVNPTWEAAYNHFHNRMGYDLPKTREFIKRAIRPNLTKEFSVPSTPLFIYPEPGVRADRIMWPATLQMAWETLTHAELGGDKMPPARSKS